ncbi:Hsp20/alpha crystallin family protein [Ideonella sp.]|uniref:Hsp20/alpha crystallin family protein n=1 Tax=Ideonella sp. TaxID=1929293 RepID=UPI002B492DF2|nr:Hsp20/alpha crystallin family protein [Ideonella sp.]HJV68380.1 Hsp20/alpha crystallin family protein [Ideonella sp.]
MTDTTRNELQKTNVQQSPTTTASGPADTRALLPRVDVLEDDRGITLLADLPGVPRDKLDIKVDGETLTIEGEVTTPTPTGLQPAYVELRLPRYRRAFTLSRELDAGRIEANLKDGVLNLRIPKLEHAQPRRISINVA